MADEINYQLQMRVLNGDLEDAYSKTGLKATQAAANLIRNTKSVLTTAAGVALDLGGVVTPGFAVFVNLDGTNYIEVGSNTGGTFYPFLKLLPGEESGPLRLAVAAPYARANTLAAKLFYIIYDT